jgi:hypothetical protein
VVHLGRDDDEQQLGGGDVNNLDKTLGRDDDEQQLGGGDVNRQLGLLVETDKC